MVYGARPFFQDAVRPPTERSSSQSTASVSVPKTQALQPAAQQALRAIGLNAWVFDTVPEAVEWLEGRATGGQTAS
jgi:hypothetical protein